MGMDSNSFDRYHEIYEYYKNTYDLPLIKSNFFQDDYRAMNYCEDRDFVVLVVPFGEPDGNLANRIVVQNNLVSYTKMYSDLIGGSVFAEKDFLLSAIELAKKRVNLKCLEEFTPIALIENSFTYERKQQSHYGIVYMARIPKTRNLGKDVASKSINEKVYFANPHNQVLYDLAKKYVENYRINKSMLNEIKFARKLKNRDVKEEKKQFLNMNNINLRDYVEFKNNIVKDIKKISPGSIMDIACGDDDIIYDFLKINNKIRVFANDIALAYIENYHIKKNDHTKIIFSNMNAVNLPLKAGAIDVFFCKNLLHHLNKKERKILIGNCLRICKTMVIVEILCYKEQNDSGKLLHQKFYNEILKETEGKEYLSKKQIDELIVDSAIEVQSNTIVDTQNGRYKYIWITAKK